MDFGEPSIVSAMSPTQIVHHHGSNLGEPPKPKPRSKPSNVGVIPAISKGEVWARPDLDWRPPGYQPGAPTGLSYGPTGSCEI
jgi:hypothetical protein